MKFDAEVFVALAAIAWADGKIAQQERTALYHAAEACGLDAAGLARLGSALENPVPLSTFRELDLGELERNALYGIAAWLTRADGELDPEEEKALDEVGDALGLDELERSQAKAFFLVNPPFGIRLDAPRNVEVLAETLRRHSKAPPPG